MRSFLIAIVVASISASTVAHADPESPTPKRRDTALWLSLATTGAGLAATLVAADVGIRPQAYYSGAVNGLEPTLAVLGGSALLVGPSLGRIYAHASLWNTGSILRLGGIAVFGASIAAALAVSNNRNAGESGGGIVFVALGGAVGGGLYAAGTVVEIATTPSAVDRVNREHATLSFAPMRAHDGSIVPGLALSGRL